MNMVWKARDRRWEFPGRTLVMGIVNVTPDSFSDGGRYLSPAKAIEHGKALAAAGADVLDIGGESTRPGAEPVSEEEEKGRILPVIERLAKEVPAAISVDTMKAGVARAAIHAGAVVVNDVAAAQQGPSMWDVLKETEAGYVCMHMRGDPRTMQQHPVYSDIVRDISAFFGERLASLVRHGISAEAVVFDPGIGFGKTDDHNLQLLANMPAFTNWQRPLLLGVSRKSFMGRLLGLKEADRMPTSLACAVWGALNGANILRVHDAAETAQALHLLRLIQARTAN
ncbi:MAG: dihydropteroate synthase [Verrucomicrobia bacterium]|nr:dihydropteroate synthase [Verrucomicrobiota bacterium]